MTPDTRPPLPRAMRWTLLLFVMIITLLWLTLAVSEDTDADWTIMVYLDGDNDLKSYAADDFEEIGNTNTGDDLVVLYDKNTTDQDDTKLYHYTNGVRTEPDPNWLDAEENMGAQGTLEDFVSWSLEEYYSEHTMLIFWDHGGAWKGCCWDEHDGDDNLRLPEIREALNASLGGERLDLLFFGACSLSTMEVCYELQDHSDYILGSEKTAWLYWDIGYNLNFRELFEHMEGNYDEEDICDYIVDESMDIQVIMEGQSHTWSAMKTDEIPDLAIALDLFSEELMAHYPDHYMEIIHAREDTEEYKSGRRVDLYHFAENILSTQSLPESLRNAASEVMDAVNDTVVANGRYTGTQAPSRGTESRSAEIHRPSIDWEGNEGISFRTIDFEENDEISFLNKRGMYELPGVIFDSGDKEKEESRADHAHGIHIYFPINRSVKYSDYHDESMGPYFFTQRTLWYNWIWFYLDYIFVDDDATGTEDGSLGNPFNTIQEAIDEAGSRDVIRVFSGIYYEGIEVNERLTIIGNGTNSVIDCPEGNAVNIAHERVTLSNLFIYTPLGQDDVEIQANDVTIANCTLANAGENVLHILHADTVTIENCSIRMAGGSGVMIADSHDVVLINSEIYDNTEYGVALYACTDTIISFCDIHDNGDDGIFVSGTSDTRIWDSDIHDNAEYGVYEALASSDTDARYCYWGDDSGPGKRGPGSGDGINDPVRYSPWLGLPAGTQPNQIYHVDTMGLIQDAVDHAEEYDFVFVHQGTYFENVMVDKPLTISGITDTPPYPTIDGRNYGSAVFIKADWVRIERFNITTVFGGNDGIQIGTNSGEIVSNVVISECNFNGSTDNCIEFHFTAEDCTVQRCTITEGGTSGILFVDSMDLGASGNSVIDCEIFNCTEDGIEIEERCLNNVIQSCNIFGNGKNGIYDMGQGTSVTMSDIHENDRYGVWFEDSEYSAVNDCTIWGHDIYGVSESFGASYCDAMFNYWGDSSGPGINGPGNGDGVNTNVDYSPWLMYPAGTEPQTFIVDESGLIQDGIDHAQNGDTVRVLTGNFTEYIQVDRSINLVGNGSSQYDDSNTFLITGNASDALLITADWVNVTGFHMTNGLSGDNAIEIQGDHVTVTDCGIASSGGHAILLQSATHATITDVKIENAGGYGIRLAGPFSREGKGKIGGSTDNAIENFFIEDCMEGGILIDANSHRNTIRSGWIMVDGIGVEVRGDHCTIEDLNSINNGDIAVYCNGSFAPTIEGCEIVESFDTGVYLNGADNWTIRNCSISGNAEGGVIAMNSHNGRLMDSEVGWNSESGLYLASSDRALVENSHLTGNTGSGISVDSSDQCQILDSEIKENGDDGVHVSLSSETVINHCMIQDNVDYGVYNPTIALPVNARWNSWGDVSGPGGEGPGTGDEVSENVYYAPWLGYWTTVEVMPLTIGTDNTTKVQLALDLAKKGDSILLSPGIYLEHLVIDKEVDLIGNGPGSTIIDGQGKQSVIIVPKKGRGILIRGLTVTGSGSGEYDAGVKTVAEGVKLDDVVCSGNSIGLHINEGLGNNVTRCVFRNNRQGILISGSTLTRIENCTIAGNIRDGIDNSKSKGTHILRNVLEGNGLGILVRNGSKDCVAHENRIIGNRDFAVRVLNNQDTPFNATHNFWGKDTGPYHQERNPTFRKDGPGGNITDLVEFAPWVDEEGNLIYSQSELEPERETDDWWEIPGFGGIPSMIMVMITVAILFRRTNKGPGKEDR